ncbi:hypothetical protein QJS10_CPA10g01876 [Acorus calamus]|uniref:Uncharacterized protein n=1 Tax=Acorus calamus TaxID=4465 RepID=A0AAV9DZE4_ACOCL|nr:hypothetical protein QJS10_CPA10g01876 [Acorus calamus]
MSRPEPCVLFAQSFVHSQLGEYVDEVIFEEPIVITACEILEQNASPSASTVTLVGGISHQKLLQLVNKRFPHLFGVVVNKEGSMEKFWEVDPSRGH